MTTARPSHDQIRDLLAAYALDAVEPDEAAAIDEHLPECPRCRAEVAAHRETATLLADGYLEPPAELWDRLAARVGEAPPPLDVTRYAAARPRRRRVRTPVRVAAVAAAAAALAALGGVTYQQHRELTRVESEIRDHEVAVAALTAFAEPSGRQATLRAGDGSLEVRAVLLPDGAGYLLADRLPSLRPDRTYQLWAMVEGEPVSAGVLGARPDIVGFEASGATAAFAISEEPAGGSEEPTLPATLTGLLET